MTLTVPQAELIGVFLESLSYGVYFMVFGQCMLVLQKRHSRPSSYLTRTTISLFLFITAHLVIDIIRNMDAFTSNMATPNYPLSYYAMFDTWKDITKSGLYVAVTIISDAFILYRCFIIWDRSYLLITIPLLLFLADIAIGIFWVYTLSLVLPGEDVFADALSVRVKTFYSITLAMNVICASLIAFKIWKIQRDVAPFIMQKERGLSRLVAIIIESASVYSLVLVIMISTYASNSPAMFIFLNTMCPIIGIVFSSVIVRVGRGLSHGDNHSDSHSRRTFRRDVLATPGQLSTTSNPSSFPENRLQISLSRSIHTRIDDISVGANGEDVMPTDFEDKCRHVV